MAEGTKTRTEKVYGEPSVIAPSSRMVVLKVCASDDGNHTNEILPVVGIQSCKYRQYSIKYDRQLPEYYPNEEWLIRKGWHFDLERIENTVLFLDDGTIVPLVRSEDDLKTLRKALVLFDAPWDRSKDWEKLQLEIAMYERLVVAHWVQTSELVQRRLRQCAANSTEHREFYEELIREIESNREAAAAGAAGKEG